MRVALIRHPRPLIPAGICYGRIDVRVQATSAGELGAMLCALAPVRASRLHASPALRCRVLAEALATALGIGCVIDDRLRELDFGAWEGQPWDSLPRPTLDAWAADPVAFAPPGGEPMAALISRVTEASLDLLRVGADAVVVSHGGPLRLMRRLLRRETIDLLAPSPPFGSIELVECARLPRDQPARVAASVSTTHSAS